VSLLNDLAALPEAGGAGQRMILALDDYHMISNPEIHRGLEFFIERIPPGLHLVIATREDPPLGLARLRARGQLNELRAADLRFSTEEAGEFLNQGLGLALAAEDVTALAERTEGWIAGLRLAAISLQGEADKHAFVGAFTASHRFLTDYLVDEVLARLEVGLQTFLFRSSILRRFNPGLCEAVVGGASIPMGGAAQTLRYLEQANLFVAPLDSQREWYRYHHLFAQFLRLRLVEREPQRLPELYRRAVTWCAQNGLGREALGYALEARAAGYPGFSGQAAELVERLAPQVLVNEGAAAVLQWVAGLPAELVRRRPLLCIHYAWALAMDGQMQPAMQYLAAAERMADDPAGGPPDSGSTWVGDLPAPLDAAQRQDLLGYIAAHRSYQLFFQGYFEPAIAYGRQALARLPEAADVLRVRTAAFMGAALRQEGRFSEAGEVLAQVEPVVRRSGDVFSTNLYFDNLGVLQRDLGQLHQAQASFQQALAFSRQHAGRDDIPFSGFAYFSLGSLELEWNRLAAAGEHMRKGLDLCREWRQADALAIGLMELVRLQRALGDYDQACQTLDEAGQIVADFASPWGMAMAATHRAQLDLAWGDLAAVERWVQSSGVSAEETPTVERGMALHTLARLWVARGACEPAARLLERLARRWGELGAVERELEALAWQARALAELDATEQAQRALQAALRLGEPGGYVRTLVEAGAPVAGLLRRLPSSAYQARLLESFDGQAGEGGHPLLLGTATLGTAALSTAPLSTAPLSTAPLSTAEPSTAAEGPAGAALNERELAVLRLMAAGRSNQEIGEALYLSVNTVRWYASQIYMKLGVSGRGAAVACGRDLGIL